MCPGRGWAHDTEKSGGRYPGPNFGTEENFLISPSPKLFAWPGKRRPKLAPQNGKCGSWSPGWPGPQAHDTGAVAVGCPGNFAQGYTGTWVQGKVAWLCRYMLSVCVPVGLDQVSGYTVTSQGPKNGELRGWGRGTERKAPRNSPNFRSHSSGAGNRGDQGVSLPEPAKSRSKTKRQEAPRLGEGSGAGPSSPGQNTASPFSQSLGPPIASVPPLPSS